VRHSDLHGELVASAFTFYHRRHHKPAVVGHRLKSSLPRGLHPGVPPRLRGCATVRSRANLMPLDAVMVASAMGME
jgi:hypothetical protein